MNAIEKSRTTTLRLLSWTLAAWLLAASLSGPLAAAVPADVQRALDAQRELLEKRPHRAGLWNDLANLLVLADQLEEAEEAYRRSLKIDPDALSARYNLALLQQETGQTRRSKRTLKKVLKGNPDHAWSHYHLAVAHADTGDRNAAVRHFALAMRLEPRLTDPKFNPHILDNDLAPRAVLEAYSNLPAAELAPRVYQNRRRVISAMLGSEAMAMQEQAAAEPAPSTSEAKARAEAKEAKKARREERKGKREGQKEDDGE